MQKVTIHQILAKMHVYPQTQYKACGVKRYQYSILCIQISSSLTQMTEMETAFKFCGHIKLDILFQSFCYKFLQSESVNHKTYKRIHEFTRSLRTPFSQSKTAPTK